MPVQIKSIAVPDGIQNKGRVYRWTPAPIVGYNGQNRAVTAGYATLVWEWDWLETSEVDYWYTTICAGSADTLISTGTTQLYFMKVLKTISSCKVRRPVWETEVNGAYRNVRVEIVDVVFV